MITMRAKRVDDSLDIFAAAPGDIEFKIGCLVEDRFHSADTELMEYIQIPFNATLPVALAAIRRGYEAYTDFCRKEHEAEMLAENAWVRAQENRYDPEAQRDLELHDFLFPNGYH